MPAVPPFAVGAIFGIVVIGLGLWVVRSIGASMDHAVRDDEDNRDR